MGNNQGDLKNEDTVQLSTASCLQVHEEEFTIKYIRSESEKKAFAPDLPSGYLKLKILKPPDAEALDPNGSQ